jgi:hypothetical protein
MKAGLLSTALTVLAFNFAHTQEAPKTPIITDSAWRITITSGLTATQTAYSDNWAGGEAGSFSWAFTSLTEAGRQISPKLNSTSVLKLAFGQTLTQSRETDGSLRWSKPAKSTDLIDLESVLRFTLHKFLDPYMAFRLESQFYDGSDPRKKLFLSPMKLTESGGFMRVFHDDPKAYTFKSRLGFALRQIITKAIIDSATLATMSSSTNDGGIESVTDFKAQLSKNLSYASKLTLYKALFISKSKEALNDDWKAVDMNWEHAVGASITKYLQTILYFQLLYDKEIDTDVRIKETLGLGLSWKISK